MNGDPDTISPSLKMFYKLLEVVDATDDVESTTDLQEAGEGIQVTFTLKDKQPKE